MITNKVKLRYGLCRLSRVTGHGSRFTGHQSPHPTELKPMDERMVDTLAIKEVIENWAVWRDSGDWERFRTVWHEDGVMMATWVQGTFEEFIRVNQEGWKRGVSILHLLGGTSVEIAGNRGIAQTKMTISQRAVVYEVEVDVLCTG